MHLHPATDRQADNINFSCRAIGSGSHGLVSFMDIIGSKSYSARASKSDGIPR